MSAVSDIITDAYREINVVAHDEEMTGPQAVIGVRRLYQMLKAWQAQDHLWLAGEITQTLTTAASYTLATRPVRIHAARYVDTAGRYLPMSRMTRQEYMDLPIKTSTGIPTTFYVDMQREFPVLYVWPVLASATTEAIKIDVEDEITEPALRNGTLDVPIEWHEAVMLGLADSLAGPFERAKGDLQARAAVAKALMLATDREGSVFFCGGEE